MRFLCTLAAYAPLTPRPPSLSSDSRFRRRAAPIFALLVALALLLVLGSVKAASAIAIYSYEGNTFTAFENHEPPDGAYLSNMAISGWFSLDEPLPDYHQPWLYIEDWASLRYEFTDGRSIFNTDNSYMNSLGVALDDGAISDWSISVVIGDWMDPLSTQRIINSLGPFFELDRGTVRFCPLTDGCFHFDQLLVDQAQSYTPGTWTYIPEPSTTLLLASGLIALALHFRRSMKH